MIAFQVGLGIFLGSMVFGILWFGGKALYNKLERGRWERRGKNNTRKEALKLVFNDHHRIELIEKVLTEDQKKVLKKLEGETISGPHMFIGEQKL